MGIRLYCPNGHKVHVKAFLAGKRGVCPECGARFDIPLQEAGAVADGTGDEIVTVPVSGDEASAGTNQGIAAASEPFTSRKAKRADPTAAPPGPTDPATIDLDALAAAGGTSLLGGLASGPGAQRLADRRKHAQKMRAITLALVVAATLLTCVLLYMLLRRAF